MAAATTTAASSLYPFSAPIHHKNKSNLYPTSTLFKSSSYQPLISRLTLSKHQSLIHFPAHLTKSPRFLKASAASSEDAPAVIPSESAQQIVSATSGDDGVSTIISVLLFIAFVSLSVLTIGVIYIAVTDFLTKREKEKFEKEEEAKKKKGGKKGKVRARAGPRGFGQKLDEFEDD